MAQGPKGNEDRLYADRQARAARRLAQASVALYRSRDQPLLFAIIPTEVRVKFPVDALGEYTVVLKGEGDGQKFVAFYRGEDYESAVSGALLAWENETIKWREDRPWGE